MQTILIVDDHPVYRNGLKLMLVYELDVCVAEADSGTDALDYIQSRTVDAVILDLALPGMTGLETLKQIRKLRPNLPVLVATVYNKKSYGQRAAQAGAAGFINKQASGQTFVNYVKRLLGGERQVGYPVIRDCSETSKDDCADDLHTLLSDREYEVFCHIAAGKKLRTIAEEMCLSTNTVSTYRRRILQKMNLISNAEITHYALRHRLIELA